MSRKRNKKNSKIKAHIQGRKLRCVRKIKLLAGGLFVYRSDVYDIEDFPPHATINLDTTKVYRIRAYEGSVDKSSIGRKNKKFKKLRKKSYAARIYSNIGECEDAKIIILRNSQ